MTSAEADVTVRAWQGAAALLAFLPAATVLAHEPGEHGGIPIWLPPLPFAIIAITLFVLAILAAFKGPDR